MPEKRDHGNFYMALTVFIMSVIVLASVLVRIIPKL